MSEVKRYHVTEAGLVEGEALGRINVVLGSDYDVAVAVGTAFGNTLERVVAERDALQASIVRLNDKLSCMSAHVLAYKLSRQRLLGRARARELLISELQQRLTAADERADVLEGLLRQTNELLYVIQGDPGAVPSSSIDAMRGEVFTALKPAADVFVDPLKGCDVCGGKCQQPEEKKTDPRLIDALREAGFLRND